MLNAVSFLCHEINERAEVNERKNSLETSPEDSRVIQHRQASYFIRSVSLVFPSQHL
jgi:hypothetical protein